MLDKAEIAKTLKKVEIFTNRKVDEVFAGNYRSSFKGQGLEVDELRKYEDGDDAKHIDWITTAKSGTPFIKKYKETRELTTMILIDVSATMNFGTTTKSKKEVALELAATILLSSLKNNDKFGAIIFKGDKAAFIPPKKGRTHLLRILNDIIGAYQAKDNPKGNLNIALKALISTIKQSAICFLISDEASLDSAKLLGVAGRKHDFVYLKVNDPLEQGEITKGIFEIGDYRGEGTEIIDLNDQATIDEFKSLRKQKDERENKMLIERRIDSMQILTDSNIYKELMMFFKKRQLRA